MYIKIMCTSSTPLPIGYPEDFRLIEAKSFFVSYANSPRTISVDGDPNQYAVESVAYILNEDGRTIETIRN